MICQRDHPLGVPKQDGSTLDTVWCLIFPAKSAQKRKFARLYLGRFRLYRPETLHASFCRHCLLTEKKLWQSERVTLASRNTLNVTNHHTLPNTRYYSTLTSITPKLTPSPDIEINDMEERMESYGIAVRHIDKKTLSLSSYKSQTKLKQWYWYWYYKQ